MSCVDSAKTLFQLQTELTDTKVEISVSKIINQVVDQIRDLRHEMHQGFNNCREEMNREISGLRQEMQSEISGLRKEMHSEISGLRHELHDFKQEVGSRLSAVETALGFRMQSRVEIRNRFYDYAFKAGWLILGSVAVYLHLA